MADLVSVECELAFAEAELALVRLKRAAAGLR